MAESGLIWRHMKTLYTQLLRVLSIYRLVMDGAVLARTNEISYWHTKSSHWLLFHVAHSVDLRLALTSLLWKKYGQN